MNIFKTALAAGVFAVVGSVASAASFSALGDSASWNGSQLDDTGVTTSAQIDFTLTAINGSLFTFDILVSNTTPVAADGFNRLTSWGIISNPDPVVDAFVVVNDPNVGPDLMETWDYRAGSYNIPDGISQDFEFCAREESNGNTCNGGGGAGTGAGVEEMTSVLFRVTFDIAPESSFMISDVYARFQSIGATGGSNAFTLNECSDTGFDPNLPPCDEGGPKVPLPAAGWLLLGGLGGLAAVKRRQKAA